MIRYDRFSGESGQRNATMQRAGGRMMYVLDQVTQGASLLTSTPYGRDSFECQKKSVSSYCLKPWAAHAGRYRIIMDGDPKMHG